MLEIDDMPWPGQGESLFRVSGRATFMPEMRGCMATGYHDAASIIVDRLVELGRDDGLVPPIIFLYRHYIELALKEFIYMVHWCDNGETDGDYVRTHRLDQLWTEFDGLVRERIANAEDDWEGIYQLDAVAEIVKEMALFDPKGTSLRYPEVDNKEHTHFSPVVMQRTMKRVCNWMSATYDWWCDGEWPPLLR